MNFSMIIQQILFLIFLIFTFSCDQFNAEIDVPLPNDVQPISYELILLTYVESSIPKFKGCVHIMIRCVEPTNKITLNQKNLSIKTKSVRVWEITDEGEKRISIVDHGHDVDYKFDRYTIKLNSYLEKNNIYKITIDFSKYSTSKISAYNYLRYKDKDLHPDIEHLAYTRMNEIDARMIFPNFDDLDMKATFKMKIGHDATVKAITNSEFLGNTEMDYPSGWVMDEFAELKNPISTFSVALAVVDYESKIKLVEASASKGLESDVEIRVSAEKNVLTDMKQTLKLVSKIFLYFLEFFGLPYELEKLDLVVLPDPRIDVLGYYGLIFLGEDEILRAFKKIHFKYSPVRYSMASKMCHAMSAHWIGHSTTMSRWNDTWLHVGLNKFLEKFCVNNLFPNWSISIEQNIIDSFLDLLQTEERGYFNPVERVGSDFTFDKNLANDETISKVHYTIRMLSFILRSREENEKLQNSIRNYLKEYRWKNSDLHQVWEIFTSTTSKNEKVLPDGITVQQIMESWLGKKGHPLIHVSRNTESNKIIVTQEPFNSSNKGKLEDDPQECWIIPLRYRIKNDANIFKKPRVRDWLKCDGKALEIDVENGDWILFNLNLHVSARVLYDDNNWLLIHELLMDKEQYPSIEFPARMHLISDVFALAEAEKISYTLVFNVMKYLTNEKSHHCWQLAYGQIMKIRSRWLGTKLFEPFKQYILGIVRPIFDEEFQSIEEFVKSKYRDYLLENIIVKIMCVFEDSECQMFGKKLFENWYTGTNDDIRPLISAGVLESMYCLAMKNADEKKWDFLYANMKPSLDDGILNALGCSTDVKLLRKLRVYGTLVTSGNIRPLFCYKVFNSLLSSELGYPLVEDFFYLGSNNLSIHLLNQGRVITVEDILAKAFEATKTNKSLERLLSSYSRVENEVKEKAVLLEESRFKAEKNMSWIQKYEESLLNYFNNVK